MTTMPPPLRMRVGRSGPGRRSGPEVWLAVTEAGRGGRPLLLVHGFTGSKEDFADHVDALATAGWHVVAPDLRGHGESDKPDGEGDYTLDLFAGDVLALADGLGWDRFSLVGHSMGGMVAQVLALGVPHRLEALVLMDTGHGPVAIDPVLAEGAARLVRSAGIGALADVLAGTADNPLETPAAAKLRLDRPDLVAEWDRRLRGTSGAMYAAMALALLDQDDRLARLHHLRVPTLVLVGAQDAPFLADSRRLAQAIPGARLEVVPDAGHSPQRENAAAWRTAVVSFLGGAQ